MDTTYALRGTLTQEQRAELNAMSPEERRQALTAQESRK